MGYYIANTGSGGIPDKSLLPVDLQDGTMPGQLLVTGLANAWALSPRPGNMPIVPPIFLLAGNPARLSAPVVVVQMAPGGTGNLHEWRAAAGNILARLDAAGKIQSARCILQVPGVGGPDLALIPVTGGQSVLAAWHGLQINALRLGTPDYSPANIGGIDDYHVIIPLNQAAKVGLGIRAKPGQTGDLQQWQNSAGAVLARISAAGVLFGDASGLTNVPAGAHTHPGTEITSPVASAVNADTVPWAGVTGKPATFPPEAHTHPGSDIASPVPNALSADAVPWSGISAKPASFPPSAHTHSGSAITSPVAAANSAPWAGVTGKPAVFPPAPHTHPASDFTASGADGQVQFNSDGAFAAAPELAWNNTAKRLGVGRPAPACTLDVNGPVCAASPNDSAGAPDLGSGANTDIDTGYRFVIAGAVFGIFFRGRFAPSIAIGQHFSFQDTLIKRIA